MANKLEELALEFQAFNRLYADQLNRMIGKTNEIIAYLNSVRGDGTDVSGLIEDINEIKQAIYLLQETDVVISGDVETKYITLSGEIESRYAELSGDIETKYEILSGDIYNTYTSLTNDIQVMYDELVEMIENARCKYETGFTTNVACGALPAGSVIEDGEEILDVVKRMLKVVLLATQGRNPSASINNFGSTVEVGTKVSPTITLTFSDGQFNSYTGAPRDDIHTYAINAGCSPTYQFYKGSTMLTSSTTTNSYKVPEVVLPEGSTSYSGRVPYAASTVQPKNSDGKPNTDLKKAAGTATTATRTYTAYYKWYFKQVTAKPSASDIRTVFNGSSNWNYTNTTTLNNQAMSTKMYCLALPTGYTMKKAMTSNNENILQYLLDSKEAISVNDANGTPHNYNLFTFQTAAQMEGVTINFEIGRG